MWQLLHHFAARAGKGASCAVSTGAAAAAHHKHSWICLVAETPGGKDLWRPGEVQLMLLTRKRQSLHAQRFSLSCRALLETIDRQLNGWIPKWNAPKKTSMCSEMTWVGWSTRYLGVHQSKMTRGCWSCFGNHNATFQNFQSFQGVIDGEKVSKNDTNLRAEVLLSGAEALLAQIQGMKIHECGWNSRATKAQNDYMWIWPAPILMLWKQCLSVSCLCVRCVTAASWGETQCVGAALWNRESQHDGGSSAHRWRPEEEKLQLAETQSRQRAGGRTHK